MFFFHITRVVSKRAWVWVSFTIPGFKSVFWHSVGQTKRWSLGSSFGEDEDAVVMTIDTWESKEVALPAMLLFSNFPGYGGVELSGSFGFPGRRLERTSSETGNKAEEETTEHHSSVQLAAVPIIKVITLTNHSGTNSRQWTNVGKHMWAIIISFGFWLADKMKRIIPANQQLRPSY